MRHWLQSRAESLLDSVLSVIVLALGGAGLTAAWTALKKWPPLTIIGLATIAFLVILVSLRLLSLKRKALIIQIKEIYEDNDRECGLIFHNLGKNPLNNCHARLLDLDFETPHPQFSLKRFPRVEDLVCQRDVGEFGDGKVPLFRWGQGDDFKALSIVYEKKTEKIGYGAANTPILMLLSIWADNIPAVYGITKLADRLGWGYELSILRTGTMRNELHLAEFQNPPVD